MHGASPFIIAAAVNGHIRPRHHHRAAVTNSFHVSAGTSRKNRQQHHCQPDLDLIPQTHRLDHTDLPFGEEIVKGGCSRSTARRELIANRNILAA
jgi:hypothetical protein